MVTTASGVDVCGVFLDSPGKRRCTVKNIRISSDILMRIHHILMEQFPYTFVSINGWNNETRARITRHKYRWIYGYFTRTVLVLHFPVVPHHVVEVDVLVDDRAVAHVVVDELVLGDSLAATLVPVHRLAVGAAVPEVVDERPQHLTSCPVAVLELRMFHVVIRRLNIVHIPLLTSSSYSFIGGCHTQPT